VLRSKGVGRRGEEKERGGEGNLDKTRCEDETKRDNGFCTRFTRKGKEIELQQGPVLIPGLEP
jgi:hypothetical protein